MPNFPKLIRAFLDDAGNWTETDPAFAEVQFPQQISSAFLLRNSNVGKCMIWVNPARGTVTEGQPLGGGLCRGFYNVYCYARATSSAEAAVEDAADKAERMRDQVSTIIKANRQGLAGGILMRPNGTDEYKESGVDPVFFAKILTVEVYYEI